MFNQPIYPKLPYVRLAIPKPLRSVEVRYFHRLGGYSVYYPAVQQYNGGAENDGHENDGPSKCPGMKLTDMKMTDMKMQDMFQVSE